MAFYRLAMGNPVVRQFKVLSNVYHLKTLLDRIKEDSRRIILFGSCADGTDTSESDIDLFVLTSNKSTVRREVSKFNRSGDRRVVPIVVDANKFVKLRKEDESLYERIQKGILLWEKE
jgi:predicted nucleotidyltransferase